MKDQTKTDMMSSTGAPAWAGDGYSRPSDEELRRRLTPMQFKVTRQDGTEPPFNNEYQNNHAARHLRRHRLGRAALQLHGQVRLRHGLAEL